MDNTDENTDLMARKAKRAPLTNLQRTVLVKAFEKSQYPSNSHFKDLARSLKLDVSKLQVWFKNKRAFTKFGYRNVSTETVVAAPQSTETNDLDMGMKEDFKVKMCTITPSQLQALEEAFQRSYDPEASELNELAQKVDLSVIFIKEWLLNRRIKKFRCSYDSTSAERSCPINQDRPNKQSQKEPEPQSASEKQVAISQEMDKIMKCINLKMKTKSNKHMLSTITQSQLLILVEAYRKNPYPDADVLNELALKADLVIIVVKAWFHNMWKTMKMKGRSNGTSAKPNWISNRRYSYKQREKDLKQSVVSTVSFAPSQDVFLHYSTTVLAVPQPTTLNIGYCVSSRVSRPCDKVSQKYTVDLTQLVLPQNFPRLVYKILSSKTGILTHYTTTSLGPPKLTTLNTGYCVSSCVSNSPNLSHKYITSNEVKALRNSCISV